MASLKWLWLAMLGLATGCGSLSAVPWPDGDVALGDVALDAAPDAGVDAAADALAGDVQNIGSNGDVGTTPPTGTWQTPSENAIVALADNVTFTATVSSPYVAPADLFLAVTLTTGPFPDKPVLKADAAGHVSFTSSVLAAGPQTVVLLVMDGANPATAVPLDLYVDTPPGTPKVVILPVDPTTGEDLQAVVSPAPDVDPGEAATQTYSYEWLLNGQPTPQTGATLPASLTEPAQTWTVRVRAHDTAGAGKPGQASVTIADQPPPTPFVHVEPLQPTVASTLSCGIDEPAKDADGQGISFQVHWTRNGQPWPEAGSQAVVALAQLQANLWQPLLTTHAGDVVRCTVLASDGTNVLPPVDSTPVTLAAFDSCGDGHSPCSLFAACSPSDSVTPTCACNAGWVGDGASCLDADECAGANPCPANASCTNTVGSYSCGCDGGFVGIGGAVTTSCADVDECAAGTAVCDLNASCTNTVGSYTCSCNAGWAGDGTACQDVDQCQLGLLVCDANAMCTNLPGVDTCTCDPGWTGDGLSCVDLNECATPGSACGPDAVCSNTPGSFDCTCNPGFASSGGMCEDVNECDLGTFICAAEATCQNVPGDYQCVCGSGYIGDGKQCDDVDECTAGTYTCAAAAACVNKPGGYDCVCKPGWQGDGKTCVLEVP